MRGRQELLESVFDAIPPVENLKTRLQSFLRSCQGDVRKQSDDFQKSNNKVTKIESERNMLM